MKLKGWIKGGNGNSMNIEIEEDEKGNQANFPINTECEIEIKEGKLK